MLSNNINIYLNVFISSLIFITVTIISMNITLKTKKIKLIPIILLISIGSLITTMIYFGINNPIKPFLNILMCILIYKIIFKKELFPKITLSGLFVAIIMMISEAIFIFIVIVLLRIDPIKIDNALIGLPFTNLIIGGLVIIFSILTNKISAKAIEWYKDKDFINTIVMFILTLICFSLLIFNNDSSWIFSYKYLLNFFLMIVFLIMIFIFMRLKNIKDKVIIEYNNLQEYTKTYEILVDEYRKNQHENKNEWAIMYSLVTMNNIESKKYSQKLKEFVANIVEIKKKPNSYWWVEQINKITLVGLKGLLYYKFAQSHEKIKFFVSVPDGFDDSEFEKLTVMDEDKLYKMCGVFIDNAIEAVNNPLVIEKEIDISLKQNKRYISISISNTFSNEINLSSTKGNGRGYGLKLINDILTSNGKISYNTTYDDDFFIQEIIIRKSQK